MDCSKIEKLLSLYASDDLADDSLSVVSRHLRTCRSCSRLADEYRESQRLLRSAYAPPKFGAGFYNGIRGAVLEEINKQAAAPALWQLPFQLLRRRLTFVAPVVFLLAASGLAIYVSLKESKLDIPHNRLTVVNDMNVMKETVKLEEEASGDVSQSTRAPLLTASPPRRLSRISAVRSASKRDVLRTKANTEAVRGLPSAAAAQLPTVSGEPHVGEETTASTTSEATRIEIQTSDPNIRIIWFSPKGTE